MAVALLCYLIVTYGRDLWSRFKIIPLAALCFSAGFFRTTLYVTSLTLVSTATISVIGASSPIFTGLLSPWVTGGATWACGVGRRSTGYGRCGRHCLQDYRPQGRSRQ